MQPGLHAAIWQLGSRAHLSHPLRTPLPCRPGSGGQAASLGEEMAHTAHTALEHHLEGAAVQRQAQHFQAAQVRGLQQALPGQAGFVPGTLTIKPPLAGHKAIQLATPRRRSPPAQAPGQAQAQAQAQARDRSPSHLRQGHKLGHATPPAMPQAQEAQAREQPQLQPQPQHQPWQGQGQAAEHPGRPGLPQSRPELAAGSSHPQGVQQGRPWQRSPSRERMANATDIERMDLPF